jgi:hypothetical protein
MGKSLSFGIRSAIVWLLASLVPSEAAQMPAPAQPADQIVAPDRTAIMSASTGLKINIVYDPSVAKAPRGFTTVIAQVANFFETHFTNPITITINVGYGKIAGSALPANALGASEAVIERVPYATLVSALQAAETPGANTLPAIDPTGGTYWVPAAEARALGLDTTDPDLDGFVGFNNATGLFDFDNSNGVTAGSDDFFAVVAHEFSEVMGRMLFVGENVAGSPNSYDVLDLLHFSSAGKRIFTVTPGYFSVDNGTTKINSFNTVPGGDAGDWAGDTPDAFNAVGTPGLLEPVSDGDLTELAALGWTLSASPTPLPYPTSQADRRQR